MVVGVRGALKTLGMVIGAAFFYHPIKILKAITELAKFAHDTSSFYKKPAKPPSHAPFD